MKKITRKELDKWSKEDLIQFALLRNDDAKDYEKYICKLEKRLQRERK